MTDHRHEDFEGVVLVGRQVGMSTAAAAADVRAASSRSSLPPDHEGDEELLEARGLLRWGSW